jgi:surfactin synthase thioesterase subunit
VVMKATLRCSVHSAYGGLRDHEETRERCDCGESKHLLVLPGYVGGDHFFLVQQRVFLWPTLSLPVESITRSLESSDAYIAILRFELAPKSP